jgi:methyl coenzyme M reductase gamma subunit
MWPALSNRQITAAEVLLHREYENALKRLRSQPEEEIEQGAVAPDDVSDVQGTWETYRNAWVEFARCRYPAAVPAIRAQVILDRYQLLKTIPNSPYGKEIP